MAGAQFPITRKPSQKQRLLNTLTHKDCLSDFPATCIYLQTFGIFMFLLFRDQDFGVSILNSRF